MVNAAFDMKVDPYVFEAMAAFKDSPSVESIQMGIPNKNYGDVLGDYEPDLEAAKKIRSFRVLCGLAIRDS